MANTHPASDGPDGATPAVRPRREYWQALIEECQQSGLSQGAFCRQRGIARRSLSFWKWKLSHPAGARGRGPASGRAGTAQAPPFLPVRVVGPRGAPGEPTPRVTASEAGELEIALGGGQFVRVRGWVDVAWLGQILGVLAGSRCCACRRRSGSSWRRRRPTYTCRSIAWRPWPATCSMRIP